MIEAAICAAVASTVAATASAIDRHHREQARDNDAAWPQPWRPPTPEETRAALDRQAAILADYHARTLAHRERHAAIMRRLTARPWPWPRRPGWCRLLGALVGADLGLVPMRTALVVLRVQHPALARTLRLTEGARVAK
jgi:hypothetical protein